MVFKRKPYLSAILSATDPHTFLLGIEPVHNIHYANFTLLVLRLRGISLTCFCIVLTGVRRLLLNTECTRTIIMGLNPYLSLGVASE